MGVISEFLFGSKVDSKEKPEDEGQFRLAEAKRYNKKWGEKDRKSGLKSYNDFGFETTIEERLAGM